nr:beta-ketoacyl-[acyl-carrier-protein] synthase II [Pseudobdellovibrionaceae bacterium]
LPIIEEQMNKMFSKGPGRLSPFFIPSVIGNLASGQISLLFNAKGPNYSVTSACASGAHSIGEAYHYIRRGISQVMIAGGTEGVVCMSGIGGFAAMKALSTRNESPEKASRPWDKDRDGFVLAEGSGILILESLEHAQNRGAEILCELTGYGLSADAYHMTSPSPNGEGASRAIQLCLQDAGISPQQINYINAHGTSTPIGDLIETQAIKTIFKEHARKLMISSTKSMMGHALGAAGAIESVFCVLSLKDQMAPPTINLDHASEECDLDYIPNKFRSAPINHVLNNSFGFGGTNACLLFSKI